MIEERIEQLTPNPETGSTDLFLDGPAEFLAKQICLQLLSVKQFKDLFDDHIDPYMRKDYSMRELPALRVYNRLYEKTSENWFIDGDIFMDIIFPANIRRHENEQIPDTVAAALIQQFRRRQYFTELSEKVPGLNYLGKTMSVDKSLGFEWDDDDDSYVPLTQIKLNFRLDLRAWDDYLESQSRTKDDPFCKTLANLERIVTTIQGLRDDNKVEVELPVDQTI